MANKVTTFTVEARRARFVAIEPCPASFAVAFARQRMATVKRTDLGLFSYSGRKESDSRSLEANI